MPSSSKPSQFSLSPFNNQLIQSGYITLPQMQQVLIETRKSGRSLIEVLEAVTGKPLPPKLLSQYKQSHLLTLKILHGVNFLEPETEPVDIQQVEKLINSLIPLEICHRYHLLPLNVLETQPPTSLIVMVNPSHGEAQAALQRHLQSRGMQLKRLGITQEDYDKLMEQLMRKWAEGDEETKRRQRQYASEQTLVNVDLSEVFANRPGKFDAAKKESQSVSAETVVSPLLTNPLAQRLQELERLLVALTQEFLQLKQDLLTSPPSAAVSHPEPFIAQAGDNLQSAIAVESPLYEELSDPGDWDQLKKDLDPSKETITADFFFSEDFDESPDNNINPFTRMPDPWK